MAEQQIVAPAIRAQSDPRLGLAIGFALICVAVFYASSAVYFYGGYFALLAAIRSVVGGLFSGNWAQAASVMPWLLLLFPLGVAIRLVLWKGDDGAKAYAGNVFNDNSIRNFFFEMLLLGLLGYFFWFLVGNAIRNLDAAGIASGFGFLNRTAGFQINQSPFIAYEETSSYGRVYLVGLQNTLVVAVIGIFFATILGFTVGIARLSTNWIVSRLAYVYVEVMRNIPLLLWIFIWYFSVLRLLPDKAAPLNLGPLGLLNIAGYYAPKAIFSPGAGWIGIAFLVAIAASIVLSLWARSRQMATGKQFPVFLTSLAMIVVVPLVVYVATGFPVDFELPIASRFGPKGGARIFPELLGLVVALVTYTAAYIAEIVRSGIMAVYKGQTEASYALGLRRGHALRLVVIPQAMRVIIPPLTSQFLNLTKNSTLAVAIAYPDLVSTFAGTALNQTGQAVEIVLMTMLTYLTISLVTSLFMNWYNARMALVER